MQFARARFLACGSLWQGVHMSCTPFFAAVWFTAEPPCQVGSDSDLEAELWQWDRTDSEHITFVRKRCLQVIARLIRCISLIAGSDVTDHCSSDQLVVVELILTKILIRGELGLIT